MQVASMQAWKYASIQVCQYACTWCLKKKGKSSFLLISWWNIAQIRFYWISVKSSLPWLLKIVQDCSNWIKSAKDFSKTSIDKDWESIWFWKHSNNYNIKHTDLDFAATKVVQVFQRFLWPPLLTLGKDVRLCTMSIECYVTNYEAQHTLYFQWKSFNNKNNMCKTL